MLLNTSNPVGEGWARLVGRYYIARKKNNSNTAISTVNSRRTEMSVIKEEPVMLMRTTPVDLKPRLPCPCLS